MVIATDRHGSEKVDTQKISKITLSVNVIVLKNQPARLNKV
jgi:hypothetical protein